MPVFIQQPRRHPDCDKLRLYYEPYFRNCEVRQEPGGPLIEQYLERTYHTLDHAVHQNNRTLAFRIDLRFPAGMSSGSMHYDNQVMSRFFKAFQQELDRAGTKYRTVLRYVWAREKVGSDKPHYHLLFLLNYDAFNTLGGFSVSPDGSYGDNSLYHRMVRAWAQAIGWSLYEMQGLVHVCVDPASGKPFQYCLHRFDQMTFEAVMYAASYLCKAYSKQFGQGVHVFGASRA
jgi:hypothetical protein